MNTGFTRRLWPLFVIVLFTLIPAVSSALPKTGNPAPDFKVVTTSGQPVTIDNYRNQVVLIDFFATWCQPCQVSVPHIVTLNRKYGKQGLHVLGMSAKSDSERSVKAFAEEYQINYPVALAGDTVLDTYGIRSIPVLIVVDKKGHVAEVIRGYSDEIGRSLERLVKKLLAEP